jgi:hypothetical protein
MFDNKDNQTLLSEVYSTDSLVMQCSRNIDRQAKPFRYSGRRDGFLVRPSELATISSCSSISQFQEKSPKPHRFISNGSGVLPIK